MEIEMEMSAAYDSSSRKQTRKSSNNLVQGSSTSFQSGSVGTNLATARPTDQHRDDKSRVQFRFLFRRHAPATFDDQSRNLSREGMIK